MSDQSQAAVQEPQEIAVKAPAKRRRNNKPKRQPRYNVILWDDQEHTPEYVVDMMRELFAHPVTMGVQIAMEVHTRGRAIVLTTTREHAELKRDQIHAYGKDREVGDCLGSMGASIEPVPE